MDVVGTVMAGQPYNDVLVWVDIDQVLSKEFATEFVTELCREWSCLREVILTSENSATSTPCLCFNVQNHLEFADDEDETYAVWLSGLSYLLQSFHNGKSASQTTIRKK